MIDCFYEGRDYISIKDSNNDIHLAAERGDVEKIKELVKKGVPVDILDNDGNTSLQHIVKNNLADSKTVKVLYDLGANIKGWFAVGEAALLGNAGRVRQLFNLNPDLLEEKLNGQGVLDLTMVSYRLAKKEVDSNYTVCASNELNGMIRTVRTLVQLGVDISEYGYMKNHPEKNPAIVGIIEDASKIRSNHVYFEKRHREAKAKIAEMKVKVYE